jgi:heme/copper-type cytochrome/quinol oxidase subunit 2
MKIPVIIWIILRAVRIGYHTAKHDEPVEAEYNGFAAIVLTAIDAAILYWGGFFS